MTASDHTPAPFQNLLRDWGHPYMTRLRCMFRFSCLGQSGDGLYGRDDVLITGPHLCLVFRFHCTVNRVRGRQIDVRGR